jgi:AcrR family transcriptional regulator
MRRSDATKLHSRGRPPVDVRRDIVRDLMEAAEAALARKSAGEITIREIAEAAGADDAMIHYYFGGKDGLMISLIRDVMKNAPHRKSEQITRSCIEEKSVKPLVISLVKHYYSRPNLLRLIVVEFSSESSRIRSLYKDDTYADKTLVLIREIIGALRDAGIV